MLAGCGFPKCACEKFCQLAATRTKGSNGRPCPYCSEPMSSESSTHYPTRDHILASSRGGDDSVDNIIVCCARCNHAKGFLTLSEWLTVLRQQGDVQRCTHVGSFIEARGKAAQRQAAQASAMDDTNEELAA